MKTNTNLREVETFSSSTKNFTIQASGKMFHMVISGLYSDKFKSITREIWSNAFDAHAMVGKEGVPFEVTFPTALTPMFSCRDFGPGIAHEDMEGFYTVLGHSTKEDTNTAVGKWGVGRMSPMSYTDTFSVVSRHKGKVAYYSVQIGRDGSPQLHVLAEPVPTTEEDGLEVSFPVKREDIYSFQQAAELVAYAFAVPPAVKNSKDKKFSPIEKTLEDTDFYLYKDSRMSGAYAQMGCVMYPIPSKYTKRRNIVYRFGIGELEVTASRESLSFGPNDPTDAAILAKVAAVEEVMFKKAQEEVDAQPNLFAGSVVGFELQKNLMGKLLKWKGQDLQRSWPLHPVPGVSIYSGNKGGGKTVGWGVGAVIYAPDKTTFFIEDTSKKRESVRAATRIASKLSRWESFTWVKADLTDSLAKKYVDDMLSMFNMPSHYVHELPDHGPAQKGSRVVKLSQLTSNGLIQVDMSAAEFTSGGYYVPMSNNEYPVYMRLLVPFINSKFRMNGVWMIPKTHQKRFQNASQWKDFTPVLQDAVVGECKNLYKIFNDNYNYYEFRALKGLCDVSGIIGDFVKKIDKVYETHYEGVSKGNWEEALRRYGLDTFNNDTCMSEYKSIMQRYPLLKYLQTGLTTKQIEDFKDYIKMIDNA